MKFCVIRHPEVAALGTTPDVAYDHHRGLGWFRVSEWRNDPSMFHLPEFAEVLDDLDQPAEPVPTPEPEADAKPAKTTKEKSA